MKTFSPREARQDIWKIRFQTMKGQVWKAKLIRNSYLEQTQPRQDHQKRPTWGPEATEKGSFPAIFQNLLSRLRRRCTRGGGTTSSSPSLPQNLCVHNLRFRFWGVETSNNCCSSTRPQVEHQTKSSASFQRSFHCPLPRLPETISPTPILLYDWDVVHHQNRVNLTLTITLWDHQQWSMISINYRGLQL